MAEKTVDPQPSSEPVNNGLSVLGHRTGLSATEGGTGVNKQRLRDRAQWSPRPPVPVLFPHSCTGGAHDPGPHGA